jgi:hypothetical protein
MIFKKPSFLKHHIIRKHPEDKDITSLLGLGEAQHICPICSRPYFILHDMKFHMETHLGLEERVTCPHPECGERFENSKMKKEHVRRVHEGKETFPCPHCPLRFLKSKLQSHIDAKHELGTGSKVEFRCGRCGFCFRTKSGLGQHKLKYKREGTDCSLSQSVIVQEKRRRKRKTRLI